MIRKCCSFGILLRKCPSHLKSTKFICKTKRKVTRQLNKFSWRLINFKVFSAKTYPRWIDWSHLPSTCLGAAQPGVFSKHLLLQDKNTCRILINTHKQRLKWVEVVCFSWICATHRLPLHKGTVLPQSDCSASAWGSYTRLVVPLALHMPFRVFPVITYIIQKRSQTQLEQRAWHQPCSSSIKLICYHVVKPGVRSGFCNHVRSFEPCVLLGNRGKSCLSVHWGVDNGHISVLISHFIDVATEEVAKTLPIPIMCLAGILQGDHGFFDITWVCQNNYSSMWWYLFWKAPYLLVIKIMINLKDLAKKVTTFAKQVKQIGFPPNSVDEQ